METSSSLHGRFETVLKKIGLSDEIDRAIFVHAKACLCFEIGCEEDVYVRTRKGTAANPKYVQGGLERAVKLTQAVAPDILRLDLWPDNEDYAETEQAVAALLGAPDETHTILRADLKEEYGLSEDVRQECRYWKLTEQSDLAPLLREIIRADLGGHSALASNVFCMNTDAAVLFYLYDDRGADVAAVEKAPLVPMYRAFKPWIPSEEADKMGELFGE